MPRTLAVLLLLLAVSAAPTWAQDEPNLIYPVNTLTGVSLEPQFDWTSGGGAAGPYTLEIATDGAFASVIHTETIPTSSFYLLSYDDDVALDNSTTYWWRVTDADGTSAEWSFTTTQGVTLDLTYPADGLQIAAKDINFSWNTAASTPSLEYTLQVDKAPANWADDAGEFIEVTGLTATNYNVLAADLTNGAYEWRVIADDMDIDDLDGRNGTTVSVSAAETFTYAAGPVVPIPSWPIGGATVYTNAPNLTWYLGVGTPGLTYEVEIKQAGSLTCTNASPAADPCVTVSGLTAMFYNGLSLAPGTTYDWQVRSIDADGDVSDWSATATFTTNGAGTPVQPTLSYPVGGLTIYNTTPTFSWYAGVGTPGLTWDLYLYECSAANCSDEPGVGNYGAAVATGLTAAFYNGATLNPGSSYAWYVEPSGSPSFASAVEYFVVAGGTTGATIVQTNPVNDLVIYSVNPTLTWYLDGSPIGISGYEVEWGTGAVPGTNTVQSTTTGSVNTTYLTIDGTTYADLLWGTDYWWRVRPIGGATWYAETFSTVGTAGSIVPVLSFPNDGATAAGRDVNFSWFINGSSTGVESYELQYSITENFGGGSPFTETVTVNAPTTNYQATDLQPGSTYRWRVRAYNGNTFSAWSAVSSFIVPAGSFAVTPRVGSPVNGIAVATASPVLSWALPTSSSSELTYELEYGTQADLSDATVMTVDAPLAELSSLPAGTYHWRVRSKNADGEYSNYSAIATFSTTTGTDVEDEGTLPERIALKQNYPNPFNPVTTLAFELDQAQQVRLAVYDLLGREVAVLVDGAQPAGVQQVTFDAQGLPSGMYLYRLHTENGTFSKTMMLLK